MIPGIMGPYMVSMSFGLPPLRQDFSRAHNPRVLELTDSQDAETGGWMRFKLCKVGQLISDCGITHAPNKTTDKSFDKSSTQSLTRF